jgi:hypothetical protein
MREPDGNGRRPDFARPALGPLAHPNANMHTPRPPAYSHATAKFVSNYAELRLPISLRQYLRVKLDVVMNSMW